MRRVRRARPFTMETRSDCGQGYGAPLDHRDEIHYCDLQASIAAERDRALSASDANG
jgi:hypothetical protein